ncbi:MAG: hypothetical protein WBA10_04215 [Elainellaceae cyanobacterium]
MINRLGQAAAVVAIAVTSVGTPLPSSAGPLRLPLAAQQPQIAQTDAARLALARAKNLARQAGEQANGGIIQYRSEPAMHGPAEEAPFVENADGSWTFTFQGCESALIGASGQCTAYTVESVVTVTPNGTATVNQNRTLR